MGKIFGRLTKRVELLITTNHSPKKISFIELIIMATELKVSSLLLTMAQLNNKNP